MYVHSLLVAATRAIALAAALFGTPAAAIDLLGKVVGVLDGDTLTVLVERRAVKVRLAEIDTPEKGQPYGSAARQALSDLVFGKVATVHGQTRDRYGRTVGRVYVDGRDVNAELVRAGHAWVYRKYTTDRSLYALEAEAKAAGRGLWALPEAQRCRLGNGVTAAGSRLKPRPLSAPRPPAARSEPAGRWCRVRRPGVTWRRAGLPDWMATAMAFRARHCADEGRWKREVLQERGMLQDPP
jgi:endonuclease YncB( thermonuclease family)